MCAWPDRQARRTGVRDPIQLKIVCARQACFINHSTIDLARQVYAQETHINMGPLQMASTPLHPAPDLSTILLEFRAIFPHTQRIGRHFLHFAAKLEVKTVRQ